MSKTESSDEIEIIKDEDDVILISPKSGGTTETDDEEEVGSASSDESTGGALPERLYLEMQQQQHEATTTTNEDEDAASWYGHPLSVEEAMEAIPPNTNQKGFVWKATLVPSQCLLPNLFQDKSPQQMQQIIQQSKTTTKGKNKQHLLLRGLRSKDFDISISESNATPNVTIRPRRANLPLWQDDFLSSLTRTPDGRFLFHGKLNGWSALTTFQVVAIQKKMQIIPYKYIPSWSAESSLTTTAFKQFLGKQDNNTKNKSNNKNPANFPVDLKDGTVYRVILRSPQWCRVGYSLTSPGFCFWLEPHARRFTFGTDMLTTLDDTVECTHVHMISHRYFVPHETTRDKLTYHSVVLLEWNHGQYCTIVEGAYLFGMGGYDCRSNWYRHNTADPETNVFLKHCPPELKSPWVSTATEIRCLDLVDVKNVDDMEQYLRDYAGSRFLDPKITFSHRVRLTYRSKRHIAQYLLNYIGRDCSYQELKRNCQTLAADLCALLAGKKSVAVSSPIVQMEYRDCKHFFLYDSNMY